MNKKIYLLFLLFVVFISWCSTDKNQDSINSWNIETGNIHTWGLEISNNIPINFLPLSWNIKNDRIINSKKIYNIVRNHTDFPWGEKNPTYLSDKIKEIKNCYHPLFGLTDSGDTMRLGCMSSSFEIWSQNISSVYDINSWSIWTDANYGTINPSKLWTFFSLLKNNDSNWLNNYIYDLKSKNLYITYANICNFIYTQKYKDWILWMCLYDDNQNWIYWLWFKYRLFEGRQYDFSMNEWYADRGIYTFDKIKEDMKNNWCFNGFYQFKELNSQCSTFLKSMFDWKTKNQDFKIYIDDIKKVINKIY